MTYTIYLEKNPVILIILHEIYKKLLLLQLSSVCSSTLNSMQILNKQTSHIN